MPPFFLVKISIIMIFNFHIVIKIYFRPEKGVDIMFRKNKDINKMIDNFLRKVMFNVYTGELWEPEVINDYDRLELAKEFASEYFSPSRLQEEGYDSIGGKENMQDFLDYVAVKIDRLIPRLYFLELNKDFSEQYTSLLTNRIFFTYGKDGFDDTQDLIYQYDQDFSEEEKFIKESAASKKQLEYLDKLAEPQGYQIINTEYLSKINANNLIEYFKGDIGAEPIVFSFFTIAI